MFILQTPPIMTYPRYKIKYILFILTIVLTIVAKEVILRHSLDKQNTDAEIINLAGRQRMLSQRISKHLLFLENDDYDLKDTYTKKGLLELVDKFEEANNFLKAANKRDYNFTQVNSLFNDLSPLIEAIIISSRKAVASTDRSTLLNSIKSVASIEHSFLQQMELIVAEYQKIAEQNLANTKKVGLILSAIAIIVLLAEFIFLILPLFNKVFKQNKLLENANRKLSDFAHIASHNLRAPVSNLNSLLYFHKESNDPEDRYEIMEKLEITANNLNDTMNTLIDALKTKSDTREANEILTFRDVLDKTKETISTKIQESAAEISYDFDKAPQILYNPIYLESIFLNLLTNSIKYKSPDREPKINIKTLNKNGKVQLLFQDNGLGINMERNGDKLFGLNKTFHRHPEAKGVGLFMTRTQIESMGGTITAKSEVDKGVLFTVTF